MNRNFDFVIFGATGFTGYYCVRNLLKYNSTAEKKYSFAIAGRNKQNLEKVLVEVGNELKQDLSNIQIIEADVNDKESILAMTQKCRVLISVIGPYALYGHVVVESCVETSTHYVDISGEPQFIESIQLEFHDAAKEKKIYIISSCGFDSIPADLGILYLKDKNTDVEFTSFEGYINSKNAKGYSINTGTFYSLLNAINERSKLKNLQDKIFAKFFTKRPVEKSKKNLRFIPFENKKFSQKGVYVPFWQLDSRLSKKTQYMFYQDNENDKPASLVEYMNVPDYLHLFGLILALILIVSMNLFSFTRNLLKEYPSIFTLGIFRKGGPTREQVKNSSFEFFLVGKGVKKVDKNVKVEKTLHIKAPEIAYDATSIFLINSAITISKELPNSQRNNYGVVTPGFVFRNTEYIKRLAKFDIEWKDFEN